MQFQPDPESICWKIHFKSPRNKVYEALATDAGRAHFWAESTLEKKDQITFFFHGHPAVQGRVLSKKPPQFFAVEYFGAKVEFTLEDDDAQGTDLTLYSTGISGAERVEVIAGWVSVLMAMKAAVDYGVDLRNHDESRSWRQGYADN